jgi:guanylate kinase
MEISMSEFEFNPSIKEPLLIVISGPSGVGKDTVIQRMKERHLPIHFVVTAATRPPRANEVQGRDYFFYSHDEFAEMIERGELLEYAIVYNDYKGIPKAQVQDALASGKDVIMRVDVQGAATVRKLFPDALMIFLTAQDEEEMVNRLHARKTETPEGLKLRIATAHQEMAHIDEFDYVVINCENHLDETVDIIISIIVAEHHRVKQRKVTL